MEMAVDPQTGLIFFVDYPVLDYIDILRDTARTS